MLWEEQRRTLVSLEKHTEKWDHRREALSPSTECAVLRFGKAAYAARQASIQWKLKIRFKELWAAQPKPTHDELAAEVSDDGMILASDSESDVGKEDIWDSEDNM